jgi:isoleucyl-tRNA synthetase
MSFPKIDPKQSFPKLEEEILTYWQKEKVFEKSLKQDSPQGEFKFFDGPPFATGLPHYGHILQGVIKDLIPRYKTMQGYRVPRVWGWDCHGLPVENLIEKDLGLKSKQDVEKYGVDKFNEKCRESVLKYAEEWKKTVARMGRWIDMDNAYKTMDLEYMDSVWWVFGELWKKGLIYEGLKPMHICPRCETPLSNFEVGLGYKDITDLSATAKFELEDGSGEFLLAWTTTPWTLLGNVALAVGADIEYSKVERGGEVLIVAKSLLEKIFGEDEVEIAESFKGKELVGKSYKPLFPQFADKKKEGGFKIVAGDFVTTEDGTGIVHIAPAFGEDDYDIAKKEGLPIVQHVGIDGKFIKEVGELAGLEVKPAKNPRETDEKVVAGLEKSGQLFAKENYKHSYPHCWRCETPLLNYATSSWFVKVTEIKEQLLKSNEKINWVPSHIKDGRFGKWLEGARDWAISRNRFWGSPLPIWRCEKCEETKCVSSKEELEKLSGEKVEDLHKHFVDKIEIKCDCGERMKRIPEVLDCWFESGSMPYAQFGEKEKANVPADFIGEAQDQTRGWFYTLHVLANALKKKAAFDNCTCTGLVLAEDGEKMSKSKQNFPPPQKIFDNYGADAMRLYLMQSPVTHAEDLRFSERGVEETLRSVLLPLWNTFYFFTTYANADGWQSSELPKKPANKLDAWILSELNILIREMTEALEKYEIQSSVQPLAKFLDGLTNWYIRRSRRRFWKSENDTDKNEAYATLFHVLTEVSKLLAPITPFLAEKIYRDLTGGDSVHLEKWPEVDADKIDEALSGEVDVTRKIISLGLAIRAREKTKVRQPLTKATIALPSEVKLEEEIIREELNVKKIEIAKDPKAIATQSVEVNARIVGKKIGGKVQEIIKLAKEGKFEITKDGVKVGDETLSGDEVKVGFKGREGEAVESAGGIVVALDTKLTPELELEGRARDLVRVIQDLRKKADYDVSDRIELQLEGAEEILKAHEKYIAAETLAKEVSSKLDSPDTEDSLGEIKIGVKKV